MAKKTSHHRPPASPQKWLSTLLSVGGFFAVLICGIIIYFEFIAKDLPQPDDTDLSGPPAATGLSDSLAAAVVRLSATAMAVPPSSVPGPPPETEKPGVHRGVVSQGATAGELLQEWLPPGEVRLLVNACKPVYALTRLRAGQPYLVHRDEGELSRFEYEVDSDNRLVVCRENAEWVATLEPIEYEVVLTKVEGHIENSLFDSMADLGETPLLAVRIADIFAWEINFIKDIRQGDSFHILVEKRYRDGEFKGYGKMLMAEFVNQGSKYEAFTFPDSFGNNTYFNAAGASLKRAFLKAPLSFTRISSGFTSKRMHPILNYVRAHPAIDYAAPTGTPVKAIGNAMVTFRGWGKGAGNYISLRHTGGYESMYLHLSGFAKSLRQGGNVRQGEVIGYVGSTGYATGPHLDFRMKKNGQFVNPEKLLSPRDESVPAKRLSQFKGNRDLYRLYLDNKKDLTEYTPEKEHVLP